MNKVVPTLLAAFALLQIGGNAMAQSRKFRCDDQTVLKVKALNATTLAAGPIEGRMVALRQSPQQPLTYVYGQSRLDIAQDQQSVRLTVSGGPPMNCVWQRSSAAASAGGTQDNTPQENTSGETANASPPPSDQSAGVNFDEVRGFPAKSWGGVVRSGPGMDYGRLASLKEGDPITLLEDTHVEMNGYTWYRIRYQRNKIGFHWGGIICPVGKLVAGTFEKCE